MQYRLTPAWTGTGESTAVVGSSSVPGSGKIRVYLGVLSLFLAYSRCNFLYHISGVASNDSLYGGEASYTHQLHLFLDTLIAEIVREVTRLGELSAERTSMVLVRSSCVRLCLDVVNVLVDGVQMNAQSGATLVVKLYQLATRHCESLSSGAVERRYAKSTLVHIGNKKTSWYLDIVSKINALQNEEK